MRTIKANSIVITKDRQRKVVDPEKLEQLKDSILTIGLLHPIVIKEQEFGKDRTLKVLVAGGRRLRAIMEIYNDKKLFRCDNTDVPKGEIPVITLGDVDEILRREAELQENILREDLTWQEIATAQAELHDLRKEQNPDQTYRETAKEISSKGFKARELKISRAKVITEHLDNPKVAGARSEKEAFAIISKQIQGEFEAELYRRKEIKAPHTFFPCSAGEYFYRDGIKEKVFDCIIADPPYGMNADYFGGAARVGHEYKDNKKAAWDVNKLIIHEGYKQAKKKSTLYMFCDIDFFHKIRKEAEKVGWQVRRTPLVWYKGSRGHLSEGGPMGFKRSYELILVAWKGELHSFKYLYLDTIRECMPDEVKDHAAQKPVSLYKLLLNHVTDPGAHVLDPCCGRGTIFMAANELKLIATGVEPKEEMKALCEQAIIPLELFK